MIETMEFPMASIPTTVKNWKTTIDSMSSLSFWSAGRRRRIRRPCRGGQLWEWMNQGDTTISPMLMINNSSGSEYCTTLTVTKIHTTDEDGSIENPGQSGASKKRAVDRAEIDMNQKGRFAESSEQSLTDIRTISQPASLSSKQSDMQYQNIDATINVRETIWYDEGRTQGDFWWRRTTLDAVASEIRDNLHGRGVIEPVKRELL